MGENEQTDKTEPIGKETDKPVETVDKPLSIVDEAKAIRDEILKAKEELKEERGKLEKVKTEVVLSGTGGGHIEPVVKEETDQEYVERISKAGWKDDKKT